MTLPISLMQMEQQLYPLGLGTNCPSMMNGYMANPYIQSPYGGMNYFNQLNQPFYNVQNPYMQNNNLYNVGDASKQSKSTSNAGTGSVDTNSVTTVSKDALNTLGNYYAKSQAPSESLISAAVGGGAFSILTNQRFLVHPINSFSSIRATNEIFADIKKSGSNLNKLWNSPESHKLIEDAYARMHKLEGAAKWRAYPLFKKRIDSATYNTLRSELESALKGGDTKKIAVAVEKIRIATDSQTGIISRALGSTKRGIASVLEKITPDSWTPVKNILSSAQKKTTLAEKIADTSKIEASATKNIAAKSYTKTLSDSLKYSMKNSFNKLGALMSLVEFWFDKDKISAAFDKDTTTGMKQLGQTSVKAGGTLLGWAAGEAVGAWAGAKLGALAGTTIAPGIGTAIGAVAGLIGGSVGCWLLGKVTHKVVGEDVGTKVLVENKKKTAQGQIELLQLVNEKIQNGEDVPQNVVFAAQQVASNMA